MDLAALAAAHGALKAMDFSKLWQFHPDHGFFPKLALAIGSSKPQARPGSTVLESHYLSGWTENRRSFLGCRAVWQTGEVPPHRIALGRRGQCRYETRFLARRWGLARLNEESMVRRGLVRLPAISLVALVVAGCGYYRQSSPPFAAAEHTSESSLPPSTTQTPPSDALPADCQLAQEQAGTSAHGDLAAYAHEDASAEDTAYSSPALSESPAPPAIVSVWGVAGLRGFALGDHLAPNGVEFKPLFSLDLNFNLWLYRPAGVYLFADSSFWGQKPAPGQTNPAQGPFDFSKREFDFDGGLAWNYWRFLEVRAYAYSYNNLNRGTSPITPKGYNDGVGVENRLYINPIYADLGTSTFDVARATYVSVGYLPTKDLVDGSGVKFKPGPLVHAYLTLDLLGERCYLYADVEGIGRKSFTPELAQLDAGIAVRLISAVPRLEFRLGTIEIYYLPQRELESGLYGQVRLIY
jgi:hypothetical protein